MLLRKYNKSDLIKLINTYENDIVELQEQLQIMGLEKEVIVKEYIVMDEKDNKTIRYIKKRIQVVTDKYKKIIYVNELNRLTNQ